MSRELATRLGRKKRLIDTTWSPCSQLNVEPITFKPKTAAPGIVANCNLDSGINCGPLQRMVATEAEQSAKLALVNKQILEVKKKIQLSEGQRKALFEVCEAERKSNIEEIKKLKKTVTGLLSALQESKSHAVRYRMNTIRLETIIGPVGDRPISDIIETLDLQNIDKCKQMDLLRFKKKKKQNYLKKLADEYSNLMAVQLKKVSQDKLAEPIKNSVRDLQNNIHAVEVQLREAGHVRVRYKLIRQTLLDDAGRFEGNIKTVDEELRNQSFDIDKLQEIALEARKMRSAARKMLLKEEKLSLSAASQRDRQAMEGKRLVQEAKHELEKLERRIFLGGKTATTRQTDAAAEEEQPTQQETPTPPPQPCAEYLDIFEKLKEVTGGTTVKEILDRFCSQKSTTARLNHLRQVNETEKNKLEKRLEALTSELDKYKYSEAKDSEKYNNLRCIKVNAEEVEAVKNAIEEQNKKRKKHEEGLSEAERELNTIFEQLYAFYLELNPQGEAETDAQVVLQKIRCEVVIIMEKIDKKEEEYNLLEIKGEIEEKWLPPPYSGLIRRTPQPQTGSSPIPQQASDEEEEVPSRAFLKRQAQLVVDAKSRRKNLRMLPKLK